MSYYAIKSWVRRQIKLEQMFYAYRHCNHFRKLKTKELLFRFARSRWDITVEIQSICSSG